MKKITLLLVTLITIHAWAMQLEFHSQCEQDRYILETCFKKNGIYKTDGIYIEIGAHNGIKYSNTHAFMQLGWSGICIEPIFEEYQKLCKNRNEKCICVNGCIADFNGQAQFLYVKGVCDMLSGLTQKYDPRHVERIKREASIHRDTLELRTVDCYLLNDLLHHCHFYHIDYLSIDTEGGELEILQSIDFNAFDIDVISVEDNYGYPEMRSFLEQKGFVLLKQLEQDLIFRNKKYL